MSLTKPIILSSRPTRLTPKFFQLKTDIIYQHFSRTLQGKKKVEKIRKNKSQIIICK